VVAASQPENTLFVASGEVRDEYAVERELAVGARSARH